VTAKHQDGFNSCLPNQASWATPTVADADKMTGSAPNVIRRMAAGRQIGVVGEATLTSWATPTSRDHKDTGDLSQSMTRRDGKERNGTVPRQAHGTISSGSPAETAKPGQLNPAFSLWLMGYPTVWAHCAARVTRLSRKSRRRLLTPIKE